METKLAVNLRSDTIAALATPPGRGGVGIIRISGSYAQAIAQSILGNKLPATRYADYRTFEAADGTAIDAGLAIVFEAPHSFTGEDVVELQGHGGPVVMDMLLQRVLALGARLAQPGEFSQRAYLNDKLDLAQAEAIADLIDSASQQAARLAIRSLQGVFSQAVHELVEQVIELRLYVESAIDFPEEEIDFLGDGAVQGRLDVVQQKLTDIRAQAKQGSLLREGLHVVIAGRPNAGKSTLLNRFTGRESAIVTEIPGTTRDVLREQILLDGIPLHIIDTAGLRDSTDRVEQEGIRRAWGEIEKADLILYLVDSVSGLQLEDEQFLARLRAAAPPLTVLYTKQDLIATEAILDPSNTLRISAKSGTGMQQLTAHLKQQIGYQAAGEGGFMARRRHLQALDTAWQHLQNGIEQLQVRRAGELLAEELRLMQVALNEITGEFSSDDLLGRIFSSFCIGK